MTLHYWEIGAMKQLVLRLRALGSAGAAAALAVAGVFFPLLWLAGRGAPLPEITLREMDAELGGARTSAPEFVGGEFAEYWAGGRNPFHVEVVARLPLPELPPPEWPAPVPLLPPLDPSPDGRALYAAGAAAALRIVGSGAALLSAEEEAALRALVVPSRWPTRTDRRNDWLRQNDVVVRTSGERIEGQIVDETDDSVDIRRLGGRITQSIPRSEVAQILRARTYEEEARERLSSASTRDERAALAEDCLGWGMLPEAIEALEAILDLPAAPEALIDRLLDLYEETGQGERLMGLCDRLAAGAAANRHRYAYRAGRWFEECGQLEAALLSYEAGLSILPTHGLASVAAARVEVLLGRSDAAAARLGAVLDDPEVRSEAAVWAAWAALVAPGEAGVASRHAAAREFLRRCTSDAGEAAGISWLLRGVMEHYEGRDAASMFGKAAQELPRSARPWENLGLLYLRAGKPAEARTWFQMGHERDAGAVLCDVGEGYAAWLEGDPEAGRQAAVAAAQRFPDSPWPRLLVALTAEPARALEAYAETVRRDPAFLAAAEDAGLVALRLGLPSEAGAWLSGPAGARPEDPSIAVPVAWLDLEGGREAAARERIEALYAAAPRDARVLVLMGRLALGHGEGGPEQRVERALEYFRAAQEQGDAPAAEGVAALTLWKVTRLILDEGFDAPLGDRPNWTWELAAGVELGEEEGEVWFDGMPSQPKASSIRYDFSSEALWRIEATVEVGSAEGGHVGVGLAWGSGMSQGILAGYRWGLGYLAGYSGLDRFLESEPVGLGVPVEGPAPRERLEIRLDLVRDRGAVSVDVSYRPDGGPWIGPDRKGVVPPSGALRAVLFARGRPGQRLRAGFDSLRIYTREEP